jgi:hypothetical protein
MLFAMCMECFYLCSFVHALPAVHEIIPYCRGCMCAHILSAELFFRCACTECCLGNIILVHDSPI